MTLQNFTKKFLRKFSLTLRYGLYPIIRRAKLQRSRIRNASILSNAPSFSQNGQDHYLASTILRENRAGFFVDIGAYDGQTGSNTAYFERELGWRGVCFEPNPLPFKVLQACRSCRTINACIGSSPGSLTFTAIEGPCEQLSGISDYFTPEHKERISSCIVENGGSLIEQAVPVINLQHFCAENNVSRIDLLCIDVEGAEMTIRKSLSFERLDIRTIVVENNYHGDEPVGFLATKGFVLTAMIGCDEIYVKSSMVPQ